MGKRWLVPAGLAAAALIAAGCGSTSSSGTPAGSGGGGNQGTSAAAGNEVTSAKIGGAQVLTDSKGFTLYWFAPDTSTASKCSGKCAVFWPPVKGPVTAGAGVIGDLGTITRADGSLQATFNGHPLYTFKGDTAAGQNKGNGINTNGGLWHEVTVSGKTAPAAKHTKNRSGGGGYGY